MKLAVMASLAGLGLVLSGCATIVNGTTQSVSILTTPADAEGAKCELRNSEGAWFVTTPGSAVVHKTKNDLTVTCKKDGFQDATMVVPSKFGGATAGNILAGGIIGVGVDAASGANYSYQNQTILQLVPVPPKAAAPETDTVQPVASAPPNS
jgi:hypothetical protein